MFGLHPATVPTYTVPKATRSANLMVRAILILATLLIPGLTHADFSSCNRGGSSIVCIPAKETTRWFFDMGSTTGQPVPGFPTVVEAATPDDAIDLLFSYEDQWYNQNYPAYSQHTFRLSSCNAPPYGVDGGYF